MNLTEKLIKSGHKYANIFKVIRGNEGEESICHTKELITEAEIKQQIKNVAKRYKVDKSEVKYIGARDITA